MFQDLFNNFLSNLEYDNVSYKVASENGKSGGVYNVSKRFDPRSTH